MRLTLAIVLLSAAPMAAQEPVRFARTPDISPDGKLVAFSYAGDVWTVPSVGGVARPLTMHEAHDVFPSFSPDGRWVAFSSNRHGSYDVFVAPAVGGKPRRLTFDSAHEAVNGWTPDGKHVLFASNRGTEFPTVTRIYTVPAEGGAERILPVPEAKAAAFAPNGQLIAYSRGPGDLYRKGYRGSANDELWLTTADGAWHQRITEFDGQDGSPMWSPDGRRLYYVSERFATPANVVCQELTAGPRPTATGTPRQVTFHKEDPVRRARLNATGEWVAYECGADIWVADTHGGTPRKLAIEAFADDKDNPDRTVTYTRDFTEYALSSDESQVVFGAHGELFVAPIRGGKSVRLTDSPAVEHEASFSSDGKKILYASDAGGQEDLYLLESADAEQKELGKAHTFKSKRLTNTPEPESAVSYSPDGARIAFLRSGKLWTMKPDGADAKVLAGDPQVFDYDWSPDGKHVAFARTDTSYASEVFVVPADGSTPPRNVTRYATFNGDVSWGGDKIAFLSQRRGSSAMYVLSLQKAGGGSGDIDWEDVHLRAERPSAVAAEGGTISRNGKYIAFRSKANGDDLWVATADGGGVARLTSGNLAPRMIRWSKANPVVYFLDGSGSLRSVMAASGQSSPASGLLSRLSGSTESTPAVGYVATVPLSAKMTIRRDEEFAEIFEQAWRTLADNFYDANYHGADWKAVREKYRPLVKHVAVKEDLYSLIAMMLGELNASHLGISGPGRVPEEVTAELGLVWDESYRGPGRKVAEVLRRGPADRRGSELKPGAVVLAVDRTELTDAVNLGRLLNGKVGESLRLDVSTNPADPKARRTVEVVGATRDKVQELAYQSWTARNAAEVARLSGDTVGYVHIPTMDEAGLESFVRSLYSDNFDKDGVVLDVRYNGGGFTHDQVLNYLGAREHTFFRQRYGGQGMVMRRNDRKWTRPLAVLINNRSYSDAEIFPNAVRTLGLGKLVGQPTGGHVIGTSSTRLIDGSTLRLPRTGVFTVKGVNMDKQGVTPDYLVEPTPEDAARGRDVQLAKAVEVLGRDVAEWKRARLPVAGVPPVMPAASPAGLPGASRE